MTVRKIVEGWLRANGYEGLAGEGGGDGCGCSIDDLMPCDESGQDCVPAKRVTCAPETCTIREHCCTSAAGHDCFKPARGE